jgi:hypothetical protein
MHMLHKDRSDRIVGATNDSEAESAVGGFGENDWSENTRVWLP